MRAAVEAVEAEEGAVGALVNNAGYSQSGAVETVSMDDLRRQFETNVFGLVRMCQLVLPGMRGRGRRPDREHELDGRELHVPRRRRLPRDQVRGRGDLRRAALRGQGLRRRRHRHPAGRDPHGVRRHGACAAIAEDEGPYAAFNAEVGRATRDAYEKGPLARLGGEPDDVAKAVEKAITAKRAPIRVRVTPSAHLLVTQRRLMPDRVWDGFVGTQFKRPGA